MADELTSTERAPEETSAPAEQSQQASQPAPQPEQPESVTPTQTKTSDNWQDDPKFKEFQRNYGRSLQEAKTRNQKLESKTQELEQQLEELMTRDMTDEELTQREIQKRDKLIQEKEEQYRELYQSYAKDLAMAEIARATGVDMSVLADAENPDDAWKLAHKAALDNTKAEIEARYKAELEREPGNTPDMGESKPPVPAGAGVKPKFETNSDLIQYFRNLQDQWDE